jgi:putative ABC transport system permease protein
MFSLVTDLRFGLRLLAKSPVFSAVALFTLTLGIGATTTIFTVVNAVLIRPSPYKDIDRLVVIRETSPDVSEHSSWGNVAPANFVDWEAQNSVFEQIGTFDTYADLNLTGDGETELIRGVNATADLLALLGVQPELGRWFSKEEDQRGDRVVLISDGLWKRRFGASQQVIDGQLTLNGRPYTIIGVMPADFKLPPDAEIWLPIEFRAGLLRQRKIYYLNVLARLKPSVTVEQAQAEMSALAGRLQEQFPATNANRGVEVKALSAHLVGDVKPALQLLLGAVGLVLLITCANVANLLLARSAGRRKEIAIRMALGAGKARLIRQLLAESLLLSLLGGALSCLLAAWAGKLLISLAPGSALRHASATVDLRVLSFALTISLLTGLAFGIFPAVRMIDSGVEGLLRDANQWTSASPRQVRTRSSLVVSEIALALLLVIGAGLLVKSFVLLLRVDPGFEARNLLTAQLNLTPMVYRTTAQGLAFNERLVRRIEMLPGVLSVATASRLPFEGNDYVRSFSIEGARDQATTDRAAKFSSVSPNYFETLGIGLLGGRAFEDSDVLESKKGLIINQALANAFFPNQDALGHRLRIEKDLYEIIGVARNIRNLDLGFKPEPEMYGVFGQSSTGRLALFIRRSLPGGGEAGDIRNAVKAIDPGQPIFNVKSMEERLLDSASTPYFLAFLLTLFGVIALALSAVGVYGVVSYSTKQRTRELGIRIAVGAPPRAVMKEVVADGMKLALLGVIIGLASSFALTRILANQLYGVAATDSLVFVVAAVILSVATFLACYLPARQAARIDPMAALRHS